MSGTLGPGKGCLGVPFLIIGSWTELLKKQVPIINLPHRVDMLINACCVVQADCNVMNMRCMNGNTRYTDMLAQTTFKRVDPISILILK